MREYEITFPNTQRGHGTEMIVMMEHMVDCVANGAKPWVGAREGARGRGDRPGVLGVDADGQAGEGAQRLLGGCLSLPELVEPFDPSTSSGEPSSGRTCFLLLVAGESSPEPISLPILSCKTRTA